MSVISKTHYSRGAQGKIEQHYWKLWGLDDDAAQAGQGMSALQPDSTFEGEQVTISAEDIEQFCKSEHAC